LRCLRELHAKVFLDERCQTKHPSAQSASRDHRVENSIRAAKPTGASAGDRNRSVKDQLLAAKRFEERFVAAFPPWIDKEIALGTLI
jgi:hypothetical protein